MSEHHGDRRVPPAELCVIRPLLEQRAADEPHTTYVIGPDGAPWTYAAFRVSVVRTANAVRALGVRQGDHVVSWLPNGMDALRLWFGLNCLGAVYVPINTAYRGAILQHVVKNSDAKLLVGHAALLPRLAEIDRAPLEQVVSFGRSGLKQPPALADREHPLRHVLMVPLTDDAELFAERFGVDVNTLFNMTETSIPIVSGKNLARRARAAACARASPGGG